MINIPECKYRILTKSKRKISKNEHKIRDRLETAEKKKKNTDKILARISNTRKSFLFQLGSSPEPLFASEIGKKVSENWPAKTKKDRSTYVYDLEKEFFPISISEYYPSKLLFTSDDFLKEYPSISGEYVIDIDSPIFLKKLRHKIYENYKDNFFYNVKLIHEQESHIVRFYINEKEIKILKPRKYVENNISVIEIKLNNNEASSHKQSNYIRILINDVQSVKKSEIDKDTFNVKFYYKSTLSFEEVELKIYSDIEKDGKNKKSDKKTLEIRKLNVSFNKSSPNYLDVLPEDLPEKQYNLKERPRLKYVLNLRGLLHFISICDIKKIEDVKRINQVLENLCNTDRYIDLQDEIDKKSGEIKIERLKNGKFVNNQRKLEIDKTLHKAQIKDRFPFLSYFNEYKNCLPVNFIADFLFDIVVQHKDEIKTTRICDLKYMITEMYLKRIRNFLYNPLVPEISSLSTKEEIFNALKNFQNEVTTYINKVKETSIEIDKKNEKSISKHNKKAEFERKFYKITGSNKPVISIRSILPTNSRGTPYVTGIEISVVEEFCKYGTEESESYSYINNYMLIKNKLLREIYKHLTKSNFYNDLKNQLKINRIPLVCFNSVEGWIRIYEDSLFSENFNRLIKMVNQYPKYQTYITTFLFETSVFNKFFCNRLFSYFI